MCLVYMMQVIQLFQTYSLNFFKIYLYIFGFAGSSLLHASFL